MTTTRILIGFGVLALFGAQPEAIDGASFFFGLLSGGLYMLTIAQMEGS